MIHRKRAELSEQASSEHFHNYGIDSALSSTSGMLAAKLLVRLSQSFIRNAQLRKRERVPAAGAI
jgi:hypothetical protein